jgi:hypothetical protein
MGKLPTQTTNAPKDDDFGSWLSQVEQLENRTNKGPHPSPSAGPNVTAPPKSTNQPHVNSGPIPVNPEDVLNLQVSKNKLEAAYAKYSASKTTANKAALTRMYNSYSTVAKDYVKTYKVELSSDQLPLGIASPSVVVNTPTSYQTAEQYSQLQGQERIVPTEVKTSKGVKTLNLHFGAGGELIKATNLAGVPVKVKKNKAGDIVIDNSRGAGAGNAGNTGGSTGGTGGGGGGNTYINYGSNAPATPAAPARKTRTQLADDYHVQMAVINSDPSLVELFNQATATQMTPTAFAAALRNTKFYLDHGSAWADAQIKKLGDPGDWKDQVKDAKTLVQQNAVDLGMQLDPREVELLANSALHSSHGDAKQITTTWLNTHIATYGKITGKGGTTADTINSLKSSGAAYGIEHSEDWYVNAAKSIVKKTATQEDFESQIKDLAKSKYSAFADQIDKGMTVAQVASPYINSMSNILEVPSASIGLNDHTINRALTNLDDKGQPMAQPLWQFETSLRQDPRWATTKNANDTLSSLSNSILKTFGLVS